MTDLHLTSPANPRVKGVIALRRRRVREEQDVSVVEGYEELGLAVEAGVRVRTLYYCVELMLDPATQRGLVDAVRAAGAETVSTSRAVFEKMAYREGPDGFLALVPLVGGVSGVAGLEALALPPDPLVLVVEGVEKPGNLGAMLRTADAAGVAAVIASDPVTDWGNPNVVRASKGTIFSVPVASATRSEVAAWLAARGIPLVATTPDTETLHTDLAYAGPVAIAVGAEKTGLRADTLAGASHRVRIPMAGAVNSLNVATAAAIVLFEAVRQRRP